MSWRDGMYDALAEFLRKGNYDVVSVVGFEDRTEYGGYCETCSYETVVCDVEFKNSKGKTETYTYYGSFSELMNEL